MLRAAHAEILSDAGGHHGLSVYGKVRRAGFAERVLFELTIASAARARDPRFAEAVFKDMQKQGETDASLKPTAKAYTSLMSAFGQPGNANPEKVEAIFKEMREVAELATSSFTWTALATAYVNAGDLDGAWRKLDEMETQDPGSRSVYTYSAVMNGFAEAGDPARTRETFDRMVDAGVPPDVTAVNELVKSFSIIGDTEGALRTVGEMARWGLKPNVLTDNHRIHAFVNSGDPAGALDHLRSMRKRDAVSYSLVMHACFHAGDPRRTLALFDEMRTAGISLTDQACSAACMALGRLGDRARLDALLQEMRGAGLPSELSGYTAAIHAFGSARSPAKAVTLFRESQRVLGSHVATVTAILQVCSQAGDAVQAEQLLREATTRGIAPTVAMQGFVINAHINAGAMDKAKALFREVRNPDEDLFAGMIHAIADKADPTEATRVFQVARSSLPGPPNLRLMKAVYRAFRNAGDPTGAENWFRTALLPEARFLFSAWTGLIRCHDAAGRPEDAVRILRDAVEAGAVAPGAGLEGGDLDFHVGTLAAHPLPADAPDHGVSEWVVRALLGYHRAEGNIKPTTRYIVGKGGDGIVKAAVLEALAKQGEVLEEKDDNPGMLVPAGTRTSPPRRAPVGPAEAPVLHEEASWTTVRRKR